MNKSGGKTWTRRAPGHAAYLKGSEYERATVDILKRLGYAVVRTLASRSPLDLIAMKAGSIPLLIQVKYGKGNRFLNFAPAAREALVASAARAGGEALLCRWYPDAPVPEWIPPSDWPGTPSYLHEDGANGCWMWARTRDADGYGRIIHDGQQLRAHRFYFERAGGTIPAGHHLHHLCGVRACVNPAHLEPIPADDHGRLHSPQRTIAA